MKAVFSKVLNRGTPPPAFIDEMIAWARTAPITLFERNAVKDIYSKVIPELGPYSDLIHRKAVMLEVLRVLAGFESSWDWKEGVDTSRLGSDTPENSEAGAWQVSYDARYLSPSLKDFLIQRSISNGVQFQQVTKFDRPFAMEFVTRILRINTKHNGPLYKGDERNAIRSSLRGEEHSIYPWLNRDAVQEFIEALS